MDTVRCVGPSFETLFAPTNPKSVRKTPLRDGGVSRHLSQSVSHDTKNMHDPFKLNDGKERTATIVNVILNLKKTLKEMNETKKRNSESEHTHCGHLETFWSKLKHLYFMRE